MVVSPWSNEGSVVVIYMQGYTVVTITCVEDGLLRVVWDGACLVEWDCVWWFSCVACKLRAWKSTVLLGLLFFFGQTTIRWHQVTGLPIGTGSVTPRWAS